MNNPLSPGNGVSEQSGVPELHGPPGVSLSSIAPRRRCNVVQPPTLMTSLSGLQYQGLSLPSAGGYLTTPTTMSSPFFSSGPLSGLSTPMSARPTSYSTAYNPQEWGPIAPGSSPIGIGVMTPVSAGMHRGLAARTDASVVDPPPPPYSPPRSRNQENIQSPSLGMLATNGPLSPAMIHQRELSPIARAPVPVPTQQYSTPRQRPASMINAGDSHTPASQPPFYPSSSRRSEQSPSPMRPNNTPTSAFAGPSSSRPSMHSAMSYGRSSPDAYNTSQNTQLIPPAARRAASTGDINPNSSSRLTLNPDILANSLAGRWGPGMPLPPPPPGPPPVTSPRARQSSREPAPNGSPASRNRPYPPSTGTALGSVPPTPAGWAANSTRSDETVRNGSRPIVHARNSDNEQSLSRTSLETTESNSSVSSQSSHGPSGRTANPKELRERRIESRNGKEVVNQTHTPGAEESQSSWPSDLVLGDLGGPGIVRRRTVTKSTPRSARSLPSGGQDSAGFPKSPYGKRTSSTSSFSTPRAMRASEPSQSPPFSPRNTPKSPAPLSGVVMPNLPPKALPTPPFQGQKDLRSVAGLTPIVTDQGRPVSHLLHLPVDESPSDIPLVPARLPNPIFTPPLSGRRDEAFLRNAERRYRDYLEKETDARTDLDALNIFCDFIVSESRIRRQRYSSVWDDASFDFQKFSEKLFATPVGSEEESIVPPLPSPSIVNRMDRGESGFWNSFKPSLSTIASMSNDEMSSRGRPASRWWESQPDSESVGNSQGVRRSKRESKYMGLPLREVMEQDYSTSPNVENQTYANNPFLSYGPNEYPPEKVGWHEDSGLMHAPTRQSSFNREAQKVDISRLVTLPPPYPRHYPGVNNNHPDLGFYRSTVRSVTDLSEVRDAVQSHQLKFQKLREDHQREVQEVRQDFRFRMNQAIEEGTISYAAAADAEAARRAKEHGEEKQLAQSDFESYQEEVLRPMQSVLKDRINVVSACINELQDKLVDLSQSENPNQAQEEGDERPELLEKLTQLKWLFEAREQLYREEYDLLSKCNEKFRTVVSLPYHQSKNRDKLKETDNFFIRDAQTRQATFASETLQRFENFMTVIEANVGRGVETQLSAFWDIAPSLLTVLQKIPEDLRGFSVKIPKKEYTENPSYYQYPLQYLYSLLSHAEKATYQFIESQTNLLCLLHEVKSGLMNSNCKCVEIQRINSGEPAETVKLEMQESLTEEERILTADLKDKVGMVDEQWKEALGTQLEAVKGRVQQWLMREGGWDDILQMEQT